MGWGQHPLTINQNLMTKTLYFTGALAFIMMVSVFVRVGIALANPSQFGCAASTSAATTSPNYLSAGNGTTTLTYDTYCIGGSNQSYAASANTFVTNSAILLAQFSGSSTASTLNINYECSMDKIDWYQGCILTDSATTSPAISVNPVSQYQWKYASSSPGLPLIPSDNNRDHRAIKIQSPTRYVRVIFTLPTGSTAGAVWATIMPTKETR